MSVKSSVTVPSGSVGTSQQYAPCVARYKTLGARRVSARAARLVTRECRGGLALARLVLGTADGEVRERAAEHRPQEVEREISDRVAVGVLDVGQVRDEDEVLTDLPEHLQRHPETEGEPEPDEPPQQVPADPEADHRSEHHGVDEVVGVVPPPDAVVR